MNNYVIEDNQFKISCYDHPSNYYLYLDFETFDASFNFYDPTHATDIFTSTCTIAAGLYGY